MEIKYGKIKKASFGHGGYQDVMIGITFDLGGDGWGIGDFWGTWAMDRSGRERWTEEDRIEILGKTSMRINQLLKDSKKHSVEELSGTPIKVWLDENALSSWEVFTDVL